MQRNEILTEILIKLCLSMSMKELLKWINVSGSNDMKHGSGKRNTTHTAGNVNDVDQPFVSREILSEFKRVSVQIAERL